MPELTGILQNWCIQEGFTNPEGEEEYIIWGNCYQDSRYRFRDGVHIHTSGIKISEFPIDELSEGMIVKTRNSTYKLGGKMQIGKEL